jgi:hypothetical protein
MPFIIQPPLRFATANDQRLIYTIIEPNQSECTNLQDLQGWGWRITRHHFGNEEFIEVFKQIEKDIERRRRQTHAIAGELHGYHERPTLMDSWAQEVERMLGERAYEEGKRTTEGSA